MTVIIIVFVAVDGRETRRRHCVHVRGVVRSSRASRSAGLERIVAAGTRGRAVTYEFTKLGAAFDTRRVVFCRENVIT